MAGVADFLNVEYFESLINQVLPGAGEIYLQLLIFTVGIFIYGVLIYIFYRFVAKRDVFGFDVHNYIVKRIERRGSALADAIIGTFKYAVIFPIFVFLWFAGFSLMLFFMAKNTPIDHILLISITVVSAIRICAYYTENLSKDLAKMLPFALLGIAIVDPTFFSIDLVFQRMDTIATFIPQIIRFAVFTILLEWVLRILLALKHAIFGINVKEISEKQ